MIKARGTVSVEPHKGRIVLDVSEDLIRLYYWFIQKKYWLRMNTPLHGAHITIFSQKFNRKVNWEKAVWYNGTEIEFEYDENIVEGGYTKGFLMYYLRVYSSDIDYIKKKLGIEDGPKYRGLHLTVSNGKSSSVFPDWPQMITIN